MPPSIPMGDATWDVGLAGDVSLMPRVSKVCDPESEGDTGFTDCEVVPFKWSVLPDAQLWGHRALGDRWVLGAVGFVGYSVVGGGGLYTRVRLNNNPNFYVGAQADAGWLWGRVGVPMSWRLGGESWLYTRPTIEVSQYSSLFLPVGLAVPFGDDWHFSSELSGRINPITPYPDNDYFDAGPTARLAFGVSKRW